MIRLIESLQQASVNEQTTIIYITLHSCNRSEVLCKKQGQKSVMIVTGLGHTHTHTHTHTRMCIDSYTLVQLSCCPRMSSRQAGAPSHLPHTHTHTHTHTHRARERVCRAANALLMSTCAHFCGARRRRDVGQQQQAGAGGPVCRPGWAGHARPHPVVS